MDLFSKLPSHLTFYEESMFHITCSKVWVSSLYKMVQYMSSSSTSYSAKLLADWICRVFMQYCKIPLKTISLHVLIFSVIMEWSGVSVVVTYDTWVQAKCINVVTSSMFLSTAKYLQRAPHRKDPVSKLRDLHNHNNLHHRMLTFCICDAYDSIFWSMTSRAHMSDPYLKCNEILIICNDEQFTYP